MKHFRITLLLSTVVSVILLSLGYSLIYNGNTDSEMGGGAFLILVGAMTSVVIIDVVVSKLIKNNKG